MTGKLTTVLGIDPGLDRTGWAILQKDARSVLSLRACGLLHTTSQDKLPARLDYIFNAVHDIFKKYTPDQVAMEENFFLKRALTMAYTVQTRGVILLACHQNGKDISLYPPKRVKSIICGTGSADKKQVQRMVQLTLNLDKKPEPDDVADAIAIAICHLKTAPLAGKMNVQAAFLEKLKAAKAAQIQKK